MSDEQDKPVDEKKEAEDIGPRGGERLAEARREQQISVLEVAKELHLDEPKVRALERNDFDMLGAPVFAKGHLRKYAQLVGVDADDVFSDYYKMTRSQSLPPVVVGKQKVRQELSPGPWIAVIIVILAAAAAYWWFAADSGKTVAPNTSPTEEPVQPELRGETVTAREDTLAAVATASLDEPVISDPEFATSQPQLEPNVSEPQAEPVASQSPPQAEPAVSLADGEISLSMSFSGDCWTEIKDATGRQLFFDMGRNGRTVELTGQPPFAALFGNVDNVDVRVDGNEYPISTTNPGGRTARLTIMNR